MRNRRGRVTAFRFLHYQKRNRFADDHASPKDNDMRARDVDLGFDEKPLNAERCAWNKSSRVAHRELGDVEWMKTVDVFVWIKRADNCGFINLFRRRGLNKNAWDFG